MRTNVISNMVNKKCKQTRNLENVHFPIPGKYTPGTDTVDTQLVKNEKN